MLLRVHDLVVEDVLQLFWRVCRTNESYVEFDLSVVPPPPDWDPGDYAWNDDDLPPGDLYADSFIVANLEGFKVRIKHYL
jgi:hypothetical protein